MGGPPLFNVTFWNHPLSDTQTVLPETNYRTTSRTLSYHHFLSPCRGRLPVASVVALGMHTIVVYSAQNVPFQHVIQASSSSWLQEHVTDISERSAAAMIFLVHEGCFAGNS